MPKLRLALAAFVAVILSALLGTFLLPASNASPPRSTSTATVGLDRGNWAPHNYDLISKLIANNSSTANPDRAAAPYAVFDWDNTSIINDVTDKLFLYQMDTLRYALTPKEFAADLASTVPPGRLAESVTNLAGKRLTREQLNADIVSDYRYLYNNYKGLNGSKSLAAIHKTPQFKDFKAKLYFLFDAIITTHGKEIAYPWETFFFDNLTPKQFQDLARDSIRHQMQIAIADVTLTSPAQLEGKAGQVEISYTDGMRTVPEIWNLMHTFLANGIDVFVVSAGFEPLVEAIASDPAFGYNVPADKVFGLRLEQDRKGRYEPVYKKGWPFTYGPGKPQLVRQEIYPKHQNRQPIFVAGDSGSDLGNFTEFDDTQLLLIVNYLPTGDLGKLAKIAADTRTSPNARYLLQGVDEYIGLWRPSEKSLMLGATKPQLLAS